MPEEISNMIEGGDFVGMAMWAILGVFVLFVAAGMFWGLIRGGKRTIIRMITLAVGLVAALLLTPAISKLLMGVTIPFVGETASELIEGTLNDMGVGQFIADVPDAMAFINGLAIVILNFIVFLLLYFIMKALTWVIYGVLAAKIAPKKVKDEIGDKVPAKKARLLGVLLGAVCGLVCFMFLLMPVTGLMQTFDAAAGYSPKFASITAQANTNNDEDGEASVLSGEMGEIYDTVHEANKQIQKSVFGVISKYTGLQAFGGWTIQYFCEVKTPNHSLNLKNDFVRIIALAKDGLAIADNLEFEQWQAAHYDELKVISGKVFNIGLVEFALHEDNIDAAVNILQDQKVMESLGLDYGEEFSSSLYGGVKTVLAPASLKSDLSNAIELIKLLFLKNSESAGYYYDINYSLSDLQKGRELSEKLAKNVNGQTEANITLTNAYSLTDAVFGLNVVQFLLSDDSLALFYQDLLSGFLGIQPEQVKIELPEDTGGNINWTGVKSEFASLLINATGSVASVMSLFNDEGTFEQKIQGLDTQKVGGLLNDLTTNSIIGKTVKAVISSQLQGLKDSVQGVEFFATDRIFDKLTEAFAPEEEPEDPVEEGTDEVEEVVTATPTIDWEVELKVIQNMLSVLMREGDLQASVLTDLLDCITPSQLFGDIVVDMVVSVLNDATGDKVTVSYDSNNIPGAVAVLKVLVSSMTDMINGEEQDDMNDTISLFSLSMLREIDQITGDGPSPIVIDMRALFAEIQFPTITFPGIGEITINPDYSDVMKFLVAQKINPNYPTEELGIEQEQERDSLVRLFGVNS